MKVILGVPPSTREEFSQDVLPGLALCFTPVESMGGTVIALSVHDPAGSIRVGSEYYDRAHALDSSLESEIRLQAWASKRSLSYDQALLEAVA